MKKAKKGMKKRGNDAGIIEIKPRVVCRAAADLPHVSAAGIGEDSGRLDGGRQAVSIYSSAVSSPLLLLLLSYPTPLLRQRPQPMSATTLSTLSENPSRPSTSHYL